MFQGIFIDAFDSDKKLAELMSTAGRHGLRINWQKPVELMKLASHILTNQPDLVVLDHRLNNGPKRKYVEYQASPLAQQLRESILQSVTHDFPIILISSQEDMQTFLDNVTAHNLFDCYFTKSDLANGSTSQQILSLVKGYKQLIKNWNKPERWSKVLAVTRTEKVEVAYQAIRELDRLKAPHQVALAILRYVIDRRGLLLDKDNVLAMLGVSKSGKDVDAIFDILHRDKIKYSGVFSEGWPRWWQHRLADWGKNLCGKSLGNLETAKERVTCLNQKLGLKLSPAKSRWLNHTGGLIWYICDSCHQPTEFNYSVIAYEPLPYRFLHPKRICWKCVETGEFKEHGLETDDGEELIVEKIQNGEIRSGT